jgi:ubiquinone/menaquinone biosynthesis C-methylase UbiE
MISRPRGSGRANIRWPDPTVISSIGVVIYQHPLAYLLGIEGAALMRAFNGEYGADFTAARLAEVRDLLASAGQLGAPRATGPVPTADGYDSWAGSYDQPGNLIIDIEQPIVREILAGLPVGTALDAACGTGRHASYLATLGHRVTGVDASAEMLAIARAKVPGAEFHQGDLHQLPVPDRHVSVLICALALEHVADLRPVFAEFVRVLRPGGHLITSDTNHDWPIVQALAAGDFGYLPHYNHRASDYLAAALPLGLQVRHCAEPCVPGPMLDADVLPPEVPVEHPADIWSLHRWCPAATNAFYRDKPVASIWHFQLSPA